MSSFSSGTNAFSYQFFCNFFENQKLERFSALSKAALEDIVALDSSYFPNPWSNLKWEEAVQGKLGPCFLCLAFKESSLRGYSLFGVGDPDTAHLYKILVSPDEQGKGLSSELLIRGESILKSSGANSVYLEVELTNLRALGFYQKHGYQVLVVKKGFYGAGRDAFALEHLLS